MSESFRPKGDWTPIDDNSKRGYHWHCKRCGEDKPSIIGQVLTCSCDTNPNVVIPIPSCKKESSGSCTSCATPCCKEGK